MLSVKSVVWGLCFAKTVSLASAGRIKAPTDELSVASHIEEQTDEASADVEVIAEWVEVDYDWASQDDRAAAINSGEFKPQNCTLTGIKVCNPHIAARCTTETIFGTVPRWAGGVWATLNTVVKNSTGQHVLHPWPTRAMQVPGDCSKIQYVQSMEIDPSGVMWVIDVGRRYFAGPTKGTVNDKCPPKIVLIDIPTETIIETYIFPDDVAPYTGSFLNDIVIDVKREVAYISSTGTNYTDKGSIVVYDRKARSSRRFTGESTHAEFANVIIHDVNVSANIGGFPVDGIALAPSGKDLYFSTLDGYKLYSVSTELLRDTSKTDAEISAAVHYHGKKPSDSDGMTMGADGSLFFGGLTTSSVYRWRNSGNLSLAPAIATDSQRLWWVDTFAFDNTGGLLVTSNKLNVWFWQQMDFSGASGANFRISKLQVGTKSYIAGELDLGEH